MVNSMTGFASLKGEAEGWAWAWDMRAVNARGLDIRLRLPDWIEGLDQPVRAAVAKVATRGNITLGLKLARTADGNAEAVDPAALDRALDQLVQVERAAAEKGVTLAKPTGADLLSLRGVVATQSPEDATKALTKALLGQIDRLVAAFDAMRATEGAALAEVITKQLDQIEALTAEAARLAEDRKPQIAEKLRENLARVLNNSEGADPDRVAQELAMIAVKSDVTEEIDRLGAHVTAARDLLASDAPTGRKLDFLAQEFNREANTLCSKAQSSELTRVGLDLKATIDQMREQVQNVE